MRRIAKDYLMGYKSNPLKRLIKNQASQKYLVLLATTSSILNNLFDLAPPILIGISIDVVVREKSSYLAKYGFESVPIQLLYDFLIA